jgi:hypothetical protein
MKEVPLARGWLRMTEERDETQRKDVVRSQIMCMLNFKNLFSLKA